MRDLYQEYIAKSKYARYLEDKGRRENWTETVDRYFNFMSTHLKKKHDFTIPNDLLDSLRYAMINKEVLPSMRALMTAGEALDRDNTSGYNCSALPVDSIESFDEAMFILLCGTGVGFSVERQYINQLPEVPLNGFDEIITIKVGDSKEGWAKALRELITVLYVGYGVKWDVSEVRPAGARLKIFGGRASGHRPLVALFQFVVKTFAGARGRKLNSIECHDIMCKVADAVVSGGVRRSACISLSNLSDERMRNAKSGAWWENNQQRALANNSICYTEKPDIGIFMKEWHALYESKSGERGIFNRVAAMKKAESNGRRSASYDYMVNPCGEIILRPYQFCNLTTAVIKPTDTLEDMERKVQMASILGTFQSTLIHFPYLRDIWRQNTEDERLLGVDLCGVMDHPELNSRQYELMETLDALKDCAVKTNKYMANKLGIPQATATTAIKPNGTVSQLVGASSGLHPRHSEYYLRRVRTAITDPLTKFLRDAGVPCEPDVTKPDNTLVFTFPQKAPEDALLKEDLTAIEHLELWLVYSKCYCEHNPSVTISVKENEWLAVGAFVYEHFDEMVGVSFLPYDGGSYAQMPFEECTKEQYEELLAQMPVDVDWDSMVEDDDNVEGVQNLACSSGFCEI